MVDWWLRREHRWGLLLGVVALVVDLSLSPILGLSSLADPLPLFLTLGQLTRGAARGLLYWRFQPALFHLIYLMAIVLLSFLLLAWRKLRAVVRMDLTRTALLAIAPSIMVRMALRIDHPIVGFYYALSAAMSVGWTLFLSRQLGRILNQLGYSGGNQ